MWLESPKVDFALVMAGTQGLFHSLSLFISQFLFFLNQLHSEAPFHVFHMLREVSIGSSKPALLSFWSIRREDLSLPGPIYGSLPKGLWLAVLGGHWLSLCVQPRVLLNNLGLDGVPSPVCMWCWWWGGAKGWDGLHNGQLCQGCIDPPDLWGCQSKTACLLLGRIAPSFLGIASWTVMWSFCVEATQMPKAMKIPEMGPSSQPRQSQKMK